MRLILTALLFAGGLMFLFIGMGFLLDPATAGADFGVIPDGAMGRASLRADFTAFFVVAGGCMIWGAWKRKGDPLLVSAALFGIAFIGRLVNLVSVGAYENYWMPMLVEAIAVVLCLMGSRLLPHTAFTSQDAA
ncbi:DUF4345 domain-containing protein [Altererythrobacter confluentis]|uniref:DUF4345 domain-containing protein n=1 Tax=Allopontixanthobacter confluentis TaxID=1849021 RepID=A0A6L7GIZ3_9SPHN|nr:DUF4345 family protein [Allopontixanthobacter confluentis]MXP15555.1 DUF4345 domain-containing protein [Allopontixanthobacter confluentis]